MPSPETARSQDSNQSAAFIATSRQDGANGESEEAFFFERSLDLLSVITMDGYFKRINPMFTQTLGYSEAEFLATPFLNFVHPDDHAATLAEMEKLNTGVPTLDFENRYRTKAGDYRWLAWTASPQVDRGILYCVARDITRQKQMKAERQELEAALQRANHELEQRVAERTAELEQANRSLQESRKMLQQQLAEIEALYQSAPIGLNVLDTDLRFVRINQRLAEINGLPVEAHLGRTVREVLPEVAEVAEQILRPILETGEPRFNVEIVGETPAQPGVQRVWLESFLPLKDGDRMIGISTVCEEITERKRTQEALQQSEERYRRLFETMEDGFCVIEILFAENQRPIDYRFLETNPAFEQQTGLHQAVGKTARQLIPNLEEFWFETYGSVALTGEPIRFENGSDSMNRWFEVYAFPVGQLEHHKVAILFRNVSDRKIMDAQREQLLQQEQAAREAAERANRMKDEFLAVLSHELRTPLNPILGWAKLLQSPHLSPDKLQQGLSTIERNAKQQVQLIEDLLDISRIIRGKITLTFTTVNLMEPIAAALETVHLAAEAKAIALEVQLDSSLGQARGDASRLQQAIWNLLSNAVKFTPQGGRVMVQLSQVDDQAQILVQDTGKGIQPEFLPYVFELFQQQDSSTTRSFGGLGLGLAIARQVIEAHGGTIAVASVGEGQGSTFTVRLPLMPTLPAQVLHPAHPQSLNLAHLRIVLVDDDADSLDFMQFLLEQEGTVVTTATSAMQAFQTLTQAQFDLLISDIGMPEMDGYAFIRQVRTQLPPLNRDIPTIALTAYAGEMNRHQILNAGFQAHVTKPVEPDVLIQAIVELMQQTSKGKFIKH